MKNAFDLAHEIVENSHENSKEFHKAKTFLEQYEILEGLNGDNDSPFSPYAKEIQDLEDTFLKTINQ